MVVTFTPPSQPPSLNMDEYSFYHSLHELKVQLDHMNQRTATLLSQQKRPYSTSISSVLSSPPNKHSNTSSSYVSLNCFQTPDKATTINTFPSHLNRNSNHSPTGLNDVKNTLSTLSDRLDRLEFSMFTPPTSPGVALEDDTGFDHCEVRSEISYFEPEPIKPIAEIDQLCYFDPQLERHLFQVPVARYHRYTSDPMTFVARIRRASRTHCIPSIDTFLRGAALAWFNVGIRQDGTHHYEIDGQFQLDQFCDSLLAVFGQPTDIPEHLIHLNKKNSDQDGLVEKYAFPALERAQYLNITSSSALVNSVHDAVVTNARLDNFSPIPDSHPDCDSIVDYLKFLRRFELMHLGDPRPEPAKEQQPAQPEIFQLPAEEVKAASAITESDPARPNVDPAWVIPPPPAPPVRDPACPEVVPQGKRAIPVFAARDVVFSDSHSSSQARDVFNDSPFEGSSSRVSASTLRSQPAYEGPHIPAYRPYPTDTQPDRMSFTGTAYVPPHERRTEVRTKPGHVYEPPSFVPSTTYHSARSIPKAVSMQAMRPHYGSQYESLKQSSREKSWTARDGDYRVPPLPRRRPDVTIWERPSATRSPDPPLFSQYESRITSKYHPYAESASSDAEL